MLAPSFHLMSLVLLVFLSPIISFSNTLLALGIGSGSRLITSFHHLSRVRVKFFSYIYTTSFLRGRVSASTRFSTGRFGNSACASASSYKKYVLHFFESGRPLDLAHLLTPIPGHKYCLQFQSC